MPDKLKYQHTDHVNPPERTAKGASSENDGKVNRVGDVFEGGKARDSLDFRVVWVDRINLALIAVKQVLDDLITDFPCTGADHGYGGWIKKSFHMSIIQFNCGTDGSKQVMLQHKVTEALRNRQ